MDIQEESGYSVNDLDTTMENGSLDNSRILTGKGPVLWQRGGCTLSLLETVYWHDYIGNSLDNTKDTDQVWKVE